MILTDIFVDWYWLMNYLSIIIQSKHSYISKIYNPSSSFRSMIIIIDDHSISIIIHPNNSISSILFHPSILQQNNSIQHLLWWIQWISIFKINIWHPINESMVLDGIPHWVPHTTHKNQDSRTCQCQWWLSILPIGSFYPTMSYCIWIIQPSMMNSIKFLIESQIWQDETNSYVFRCQFFIPTHNLQNHLIYHAHDWKFIVEYLNDRINDILHQYSIIFLIESQMWQDEINSHIFRCRFFIPTSIYPTIIMNIHLFICIFFVMK